MGFFPLFHAERAREKKIIYFLHMSATLLPARYTILLQFCQRFQLQRIFYLVKRSLACHRQRNHSSSAFLALNSTEEVFIIWNSNILWISKSKTNSISFVWIKHYYLIYLKMNSEMKSLGYHIPENQRWFFCPFVLHLKKKIAYIY